MTKFPCCAIYVDEVPELRLNPIPFNFGQTGEALFDPAHTATLTFVPDGDPGQARRVDPRNLYFPTL